LPWEVGEESELVDKRAFGGVSFVESIFFGLLELTSWRDSLEKFWNDSQKLLAVLRVTPSSASNSTCAVDDEMLRPTIWVLHQTAESLAVLSSGPAVERGGDGVLHDEVHEILIALECVAEAHERKDLLALSDTNGGWEFITIAVFPLAEDEEIAGDFVSLNPDMYSSHNLPGVNWTL
jgi:hypothetical protein